MPCTAVLYRDEILSAQFSSTEQGKWHTPKVLPKDLILGPDPLFSKAKTMLDIVSSNREPKLTIICGIAGQAMLSS